MPCERWRAGKRILDNRSGSDCYRGRRLGFGGDGGGPRTPARSARFRAAAAARRGPCGSIGSGIPGTQSARSRQRIASRSRRAPGRARAAGSGSSRSGPTRPSSLAEVGEGPAAGTPVSGARRPWGFWLRSARRTSRRSCRQPRVLPPRWPACPGAQASQIGKKFDAGATKLTGGQVCCQRSCGRGKRVAVQANSLPYWLCKGNRVPARSCPNEHLQRSRMPDVTHSVAPFQISWAVRVEHPAGEARQPLQASPTLLILP
jgi:hypothetical protein